MRRQNLASIYRWLVMLTAGLVLLQALFAGRGLWINSNFLNYHEILANILFLAVVVQFFMTIQLRIPGALGRRMMMLNGALVVLILMQTALGYMGRTDAEASAWHIPLGVLIFGLTVAIVAMVPQLGIEREIEE